MSAGRRAAALAACLAGVIACGHAAESRAGKAATLPAASVCEHVRDALRAGRASLDAFGDEPLTWSDVTDESNEEHFGDKFSEFDFDNDGVVDRVFRTDYASRYMTGSTLAVLPRQPGQAVPGSAPAGWSADPDAVFLPCQWNSRPIDLTACAPFSQANDEAGFAVARRAPAKPVYFRARYSDLIPFRFGGRTLVTVISASEDSVDYVAVVQPLRARRFVPICLLRRGRIVDSW